MHRNFLKAFTAMRTLIAFAAIAALAYAGLAIYLWLFQSRFVYFPDQPGRELEGNPGNIGLDFSDALIETSDGVILHGWFIPGHKGPVVLYFHGNAGNVSHRLSSIQLFHRLGASVLIIDYRGYGRSGGTAGEPGTYEDALAAWRYLTRERGIDPRNIVIFGRSLGGAVAAWLAAEVSPRALILESTFTSIPDMARHAFPYLPSSLTRIRYDTLSKIASIECPILLMHSRDDELIPFDMALRLRDAAPAATEFFELDGGHNDGHALTGERYVDTLRNFLQRQL